MRPTTWRQLFFLLAWILELAGVCLSAHGVVRESFVELAKETGGFSRKAFDIEGFDPSAFDFGDEPPDLLLRIGLALDLLPSRGELTAEHRRENAWHAVIGVVLVITGMVLSAVTRWWQALSAIKARVWGCFRAFVRRRWISIQRWWRNRKRVWLA